MAQPGNFTPILLYGSSTPTNVPLAANLTNSATGSEIAINVADKNLFFKDSGGVVNTVPIRQSSTSSNGWLSATDWNTFNSKQAALISGTNIKTVGGVTLLGSGDVGTIGVAYGGTGVTTSTGSVNNVLSTSPTLTTPIISTTLGVGGATPSASGAGITFPATQSASTDPNTLDDYEEGTWTPTQGAGLTVVGSFSSTGKYTKIGRLVTIEASLIGSTSIACSAGGAITSGLPFAVANVGGGTAANGALTAGSVLYVVSPIYSITAIVASGSIQIFASYYV